jgi:hypothetical protein
MYNRDGTFAKVAASSDERTGRGERRGGRKKGARNKRTLAQIALAQGLETPLDYLLAVMRDETADIDRRMECAVAAAPYMHAKLKAIETSGKEGQPIDSRVVLTFD